MVKPSRGCITCRNRHKKCDELEPSCTQCVKTGLNCPGYRSQFDIAWRNQNQVAEKNVKRRENAREKSSSERKNERNPSRSASRSPVFRPLTQDYEQYALDLFLPIYILAPRDPGIQSGFMSCLYPVWEQSGPASVLRPAVIAVSLWMLEAWSGIMPAQSLSLAYSQYHQAVNTLRNRLQNNTDVDDEVVLAALFLDMFENMHAFRTAKVNKSPHVKGAIALLERRKRLPAYSKVSQEVVLATRQHVLQRLLGSSDPVPVDVLTLNDISDDSSQTPGNRHDELNTKVAGIRYRTMKLSGIESISASGVVEIFEAATKLDREMLDWEQSMPSDWRPIRVSGDTCIPESVRWTGMYQDYCDVYSSVLVAERVNVHRSSRIKIHLVLLECLKHIGDRYPVAATSSVLGTIQLLVDEICASFPSHLGDRTSSTSIHDKTTQYPSPPGRPVSDEYRQSATAFAGFLVTRRLGELLSLPVPLRDGQRQWMGGQMQRVKTIYNVQPS